MGGAEKSTLTRLKYQPTEFTSQILNLRPHLQGIQNTTNVTEFSLSSNQLVQIFQLWKKIKLEEPDIIIARTPADLIRITVVRALSRRSSWMLVFEAHSRFITEKKALEKPMHLLYRLCTRKVDLTFAVSKSVIGGQLCRNHKNIVLHYLGADLTPSPDMFAPGDHPRLLFVGRLVAVKNPLWLIQILDNINRYRSLPRRFLTVVGDGPLYLAIQELTKRSGLQDIVTLAGVQHDITPFLLSHSHLVSCSLSEGLPITFFEAKLAGMKILTTPSGGGSEILNHFDTLLSDYNQEEFEMEILRILDRGSVSLEERKTICLDSQWMQASLTTARYYEVLKEELSQFQNVRT